MPAATFNRDFVSVDSEEDIRNILSEAGMEYIRWEHGYNRKYTFYVLSGPSQEQIKEAQEKVIAYLGFSAVVRTQTYRKEIKDPVIRYSYR